MRAACLIEEVPKFWLDGALVRMEIRNGKRLAVKMDIAISWHAAMGALIEEWAVRDAESPAMLIVRGEAV